MPSDIPITKKELDSMEFFSAILLGFALAMDAAAVSAVCGLNGKSNQLSSALITAFTFAVFQTVMPILGWSIGKLGNNFFSFFNNIFAFAVLLFLGVKMLFDTNKQDYPTISNFKSLFVLAIATSIDALTAGITLPVTVNALSVFSMFQAVSVIGIVTFILSLLAYTAGHLFHNLNPKLAGFTGGFMLILIAFKTLFF